MESRKNLLSKIKNKIFIKPINISKKISALGFPSDFFSGFNDQAK